MEDILQDILHHLGWLTPSKEWDEPPIKVQDFFHTLYLQAGRGNLGRCVCMTGYGWAACGSGIGALTHRDIFFSKECLLDWITS